MNLKRNSLSEQKFPRVYILYYSIYITFLKRQNYKMETILVIASVSGRNGHRREVTLVTKGEDKESSWDVNILCCNCF